jgi:nicotinamidase-related amidase
MKESPTPNIAIMIVDMQNAYFNNGTLRDRQIRLTENINEIISIAKHHSLPAFNIRTEHQKDIASWTLNMLDDKQGYLFSGESDSQNVPNLIVDNIIPVTKTRDSAFHETTLLSMLRNYDITTVVICGVSTHTCIFQTASDAYALNLRVILANDAIATHQPQYHQPALNILETEYRQKTMTNKELQKYIQNNRQ